MSTKFHIQIIYIHDKCALPFEFIHPYKLSLFFVCVHKISLTPPLYIEVSVPSQESERLCVLEHGINLATFYNNLVDFFTVPIVRYFFFHLIINIISIS
jgi:hypothetical protein